MDKRKRRLLCMLEGSGKKSRWISGVPPLQYSAKKQGTLKNYRIYGNTVGGESVGDRTANLFDGEWENKYIVANGFIGYSTNRVLSSKIHVVAGQTYTVTAIFLIRAVHSYNGTVHTQVLFDEVSGAGEVTFTIPDGSDSILISLKKANDGNFTPDDVEWCMLNEGSTAIPYEPYGYKVPVTVSNGTDTLTTPIYLPEQIRKVGEEAEYIDYGEQKMHRVRKNLVSSYLVENSREKYAVTLWCEIDFKPNTEYILDFIYAAGAQLYTNEYVFETVTYTNALGGKRSLHIKTKNNIDKNSGNKYNANKGWIILKNNATATEDIEISNVQIRLATIEDDTYEPYIENTDLDVTLPALPTLTGTNVLSVGTAVQPSKIEVKGKIKAL